MSCNAVDSAHLIARIPSLYVSRNDGLVKSGPETRRLRGVIGQAANRAIDDPSVAVVHHPAEPFDDLRAFMRSDESRLVMEQADFAEGPFVGR